ncbi:hypothetical protein IPC831_11160 [Pseudomonas aeruginosa]|nr:hypothetical protein IPC831_11160 [Pseudomonas aeruginosa]
MVRANPQDWQGYEVRELAVIPAGHVVVPREVLERFMQKIHNRTEYDDVKAARAELRALLSEQE